jgi:hypothetical protein
MNLKKLESLFIDSGCQKIYVKKLSKNDNSKNQVYLGGGFEILNVFPMSDVVPDVSKKGEETFKAKLKFSWLGDNGNIYPAPQAQLILYPDYPEVRFSGFLARCENPPSELMTQRLPNRLLFFGVGKDGTVLGYVTSPDSEIANEFAKTKRETVLGVFNVIELTNEEQNKKKLFAQLRRIHLLNWIKSKRLDKSGNILPCSSTNCGGYTLEAELGITPNGFSDPDYLGWEIKNFGVKNFNNINNARITLMTPEPTHGLYITEGVDVFIKKYGYNDLSGKPDRMNFGGIHKVGAIQQRTRLGLQLIGYDAEAHKIKNVDGMIALVDEKDNIAASWSFSSMLKHWNRKHNQACYVPSLTESKPEQRYKYGDKAILGEGTDFQLFLEAMQIGNIVYDPGIKIENMSSKPKVKRRSQFRIASSKLSSLYKHSEIAVI